MNESGKTAGHLVYTQGGTNCYDIDPAHLKQDHKSEDRFAEPARLVFPAHSNDRARSSAVEPPVYTGTVGSSILSAPTTPPTDADYYDESGYQHRIDSGDLVLIPPDMDMGLYILLGLILVGSAALAAASTYVLLGL